MTDRQALLAAIRAHPDEDTPRLAFADWLDERGDTFFSHWAALIRTQIEAANTERFTRRWLELVEQQRLLFAARPREWTMAWGSRLGPMAFRRGFREAATLAAKSFPEAADQAFASNPIRAVALTGLANPYGRLHKNVADHPGLAFVETLDLAGNDSALVTEFLATAAEGMPRLRALGLGGQSPNNYDEDDAFSNFAARDIGDILALPGLSGVTALDLHGNPLFLSLSEGNPVSLFHAPAMERMRWLDLADTGITPPALHTLAHSKRVKNLRVLILSRERIMQPPPPILGPLVGVILADGPAVRGVEYLDLSGQQIGTEGIRMIVRTSLLSTVRELRLEGCELGDEGAEILAGCPHLAGLRRLELAGNGITEVGAEALCASPHLQGLTVLGGVHHLSAAHRDRFTSLAGDPFTAGAPIFQLIQPCP